MTDCFPQVAPTNPVNQLILDVFGENFFPPYDASFQPSDRSKLSNEKTLNLDLPGGGVLKPSASPEAPNIGAMISSVVGQLSPIFAFFGPIYLILDLIRAIIDIICALFNPQPMIAAAIDLFVNVLPPIISLYPPFSSLLLALNIVKVISAIVASLIAVVAPTIKLIVDNFNSIALYIANGNLASVSSITAKICTLIQRMSNELAVFDPISPIIDILKFFLSLGTKLFCASDSSCCDTNSCPPIITDPPVGTGQIIASVIGITLGSLIPGLPEDAAAIQLGPASSITIQDTLTLELSELKKYIVDPSSLPPTSDGSDRGSIRAVITGNGITITGVLSDAGSGQFTVNTDTSAAFPVGTVVSYEIQPDTMALFTSNLIGFGCLDEIKNAAAGAAAQVGSTAPGADKIGLDFPSIDAFRGDIQTIIDNMAADPGTDRSGDVLEIGGQYLNDLAVYYSTIICVAVNNIKTDFTVSSPFATADGKSATIVRLTPKDASGVSLLVNSIPNTSDRFTAIFNTTFGQIGDVSFDAATGSFSAPITSDTPGKAEVSAIFVVNGGECVRPATTDGFTVSEKINVITFIGEGGAFPRRRPTRQFIQSAGGRRR